MKVSMPFLSWTAKAALEIDIPDNTEPRWHIRAAIEIAVSKGFSLNDASFIGANLNGANLNRANLDGANLNRASLNGANLNGASFIGANLNDASFIGASLNGASLNGASLNDASFIGANLNGANLNRANLDGANLNRASLNGANLDGASFIGANLNDASFIGASLDGASFIGAIFNGIRADLIAEIIKLPDELPALRLAIVEGRINGSSYAGTCACLAGTLAKAHGIDRYEGDDIPINGMVFHANASSLREKWFLGIKVGDTPETSQIAKITLAWVDEAIMMVDHIRATARDGRVGLDRRV